IPVHPNALKPDGIQHARGCLDDALWGVPFARSEKKAFRCDGPQRRKVDGVGVLDPVAITPAGGNQRIGEPERSDLYRKIHFNSWEIAPASRPSALGRPLCERV